MARHDYFASQLMSLAEKYPALIRGPFGEGMMIAFTPGDGSFDQAKRLMMTMYDVGLLGFVCGSDPTRIRFLPPPATTTFEHIDAAIALRTHHAYLRGFGVFSLCRDRLREMMYRWCARPRSKDTAQGI